MNLCERTVERLNKVITGFFDRYGLLQKNPVWEIRESPSGGFGVFVKRDVNVGEVIFTDFPVILGPRCVADCPRLCVSCLSKTNLQPCKKGCGLPVCSQICHNLSSHQKECKIIREYRETTNTGGQYDQKLFENFTPIKSLLLNQEDKEVVLSLIAHNSDQHGHEIETLKNKLGFQFKEDDEKFLKFVCCVLDANAFEVTLLHREDQNSLRGLYTLGSLVNHSCVPNVTHVFNNTQHMITQAAVFIPKNSEIFHSYTRVIWGTTTRLYHLHNTKHFVCRCPRCRDPTEFGTFMGSILCKLCRGVVSPLNPFKSFGRWQCRDCKNVISGKDAGQVLFLLGSILKTIEPNDFTFMYKMLNGKLKSVVPGTNQVAAELKYMIIWTLGHKDGYKWNELTKGLLKIKETLCNDLLDILEKLRCGQSKMRGLLLYEMYCCKREIINRQKSKKQILVGKDIKNILTEAATILRYDSTAPEEIKKFDFRCDHNKFVRSFKGT